MKKPGTNGYLRYLSKEMLVSCPRIPQYLWLLTTLHSSPYSRSLPLGTRLHLPSTSSSSLYNSAILVMCSFLTPGRLCSWISLGLLALLSPPSLSPVPPFLSHSPISVWTLPDVSDCALPRTYNKPSPQLDLGAIMPSFFAQLCFFFQCLKCPLHGVTSIAVTSLFLLLWSQRRSSHRSLT